MKTDRYIYQLLSNREGNVGMTFALLLLPIIGMTGAAVDYGRVAQLRSEVATAADAAALEGARSEGTLAERKEAARRVFEFNMRNRLNQIRYEDTFEPVIENGLEVGYRARISATAPAFFMPLVGVKDMPMTIQAEARGSVALPTDIAFVLDTTRSMQGSRIATLKSATTELVTEMEKKQTPDGAIRMSVVPFGQYVNVGLHNRSQPWLNVPNDYQEPFEDKCKKKRPVIGEQNCRTEVVPAQPAKPPGTCYDDGVPRQCGGSPAKPATTKRVCDKIYGDEVLECKREGGDWVRWSGCVGSRSGVLEQSDSNYSHRIPGLMNLTCGSPITEPTDKLAQVRTAINGLDTNGETYIPSGLIWGWRMLSPHAPIEARSTVNGRAPKRFIILVTDGLNTKSPTFPKHDGNSTSEANTITRNICANIAADPLDITIYTIAFEVNDNTVKEILRTCSSSTGGEFFDATNASRLTQAFKEIAKDISSLRLSK